MTTTNNLALKSLEQFSEAFANVGKAITSSLLPLFEQLKLTMKAVYDAFWQAYREAGMPYGETDEGMLRWAREVGEAQRMRLEAERILAHHETLAKLRQTVKEKVTNIEPA